MLGTGQILSRLDTQDIECCAWRFAGMISKTEVWEVTLKSENDGIKLRCEARGSTFDQALSLAWTKFDSATNTGIPEMAGTLLEHNPADDEVSF